MKKKLNIHKLGKFMNVIFIFVVSPDKKITTVNVITIFFKNILF